MFNRLRNFLGTYALVVVAGGTAGVVVGACEDGELREEITCNQYCRQAHDCDDSIDRDQCEEDCEDAVSDCQDDEKAEALDDLDNCANESCNDFGACTVGAGLQCTFGI